MTSFDIKNEVFVKNQSSVFFAALFGIMRLLVFDSSYYGSSAPRTLIHPFERRMTRFDFKNEIYAKKKGQMVRFSLLRIVFCCFWMFDSSF